MSENFYKEDLMFFGKIIEVIFTPIDTFYICESNF